jgi:hypothetical protein
VRPLFFQLTAQYVFSFDVYLFYFIFYFFFLLIFVHYYLLFLFDAVGTSASCSSPALVSPSCLTSATISSRSPTRSCRSCRISCIARCVRVNCFVLLVLCPPIFFPSFLSHPTSYFFSFFDQRLRVCYCCPTIVMPCCCNVKPKACTSSRKFTIKSRS